MSNEMKNAEANEATKMDGLNNDIPENNGGDDIGSLPTVSTGELWKDALRATKDDVKTWWQNGAPKRAKVKKTLKKVAIVTAVIGGGALIYDHMTNGTPEVDQDRTPGLPDAGDDDIDGVIDYSIEDVEIEDVPEEETTVADAVDETSDEA